MSNRTEAAVNGERADAPDSKGDPVALTMEMKKQKPEGNLNTEKAKRKSANQKLRKNATAKAGEESKPARRVSNFPACTFEEALEIPNAIQEHASGHTIRRLTLFD